LNPEIKNETLPRGDYALIIPKGRAEQFNKSFPDLLSRERDGGIRNNKNKPKTH